MEFRRVLFRSQTLVTDKDRIYDDALGGKAYYLGHAELEIPLGSGAQELGLRPSIFMDFGALFDVKKPLPTAVFPTHEDADGNVIVDPIINHVFEIGRASWREIVCKYVYIPVVPI